MEWQDIKDKLSNISDFSETVFNASRDNDALFDFIDALPLEVKNELYPKYINSDGPVLGIRKQIVEEFLNRPVNREGIIKRFETGKLNNPKRFTQYKNLFAVLYPFFTFGTNKLVYDTLDELAKKIQTDLQLVDKTDIKTIGFEGGRNTGSEHVWFAIYNNSYPNQKNAKQLFFSIHNATVTYAIYDRGKDYFIEKETTDVASLDYTALLEFYTKHKNAILSDNYRANLLLKYPLEKLISSLKAGEIKSWLIKPGEKGSMWKKALKEENIRIGWGYVVDDMYVEDNFEEAFILKKLDEHYPKEGTRQTNNKTTIKSFVVDVAENDIVFAVSGTSDIIGMGIITSHTELDEDDEEYKAFHTVDWLIDLSKNPYHPNYGLPIKTVTALETKYAVPIISSIFNYTPLTKKENMELPFINTILYGPPGTGKTYELNSYKKQLFTDANKEASKEELLIKKVKENSLWEIVAAVLIVKDGFTSVTDICESELVKLKKDPKKPTRSYYLVRNSLIAYSDDSSSEYKKKRKDRFFTKNEKAEWSVIPESKEELITIIGDDLIKLAKGDNVDAAPNELKELSSRYNFITFHQKYSYEDFIEGIKPLLQDDDSEEQAGDLQFELKRGIFYNSCLEALKLVGYNSFEESYADSFEGRKAKFEVIKPNPVKQFALFIDEINRANISAVFGELITLLEDDKRMGADNEMWVELPYSNEKFSVPANLYVIGTMNTADRSIALLDIALRRRFEFKALYPLYTETEWWSALLTALNQSIYNWKKNPDFFIGHAFFINRPEDDRIKILNTKIIPLLYEYCQNNAETVKRILSEAGVQIRTTTIKENFQIIAE